jgi:hypothetical protein
MYLELVECTDRAGVENEDLYLKKPDVRQPFELQSAAVQYTSQLRLLQSPATELDFPIVNDQRSELRQAARLLKVAQAANLNAYCCQARPFQPHIGCLDDCF